MSLDPGQGRVVGVPTAAGSYKFDIQRTDANQVVTRLSFSLTITQPKVEASPASLTLAGLTDGPSATSVVSVGAGIGGQPYTVATTTSDGKAWLSATVSSKSTPGSIQVTANPAGLPAAAYQGALTISLPGANPSSVTVAVALTVQAAAAPMLKADPSAATFALVQGGAAATQAVAVSNTGSGSVQVTVTPTTFTGGNWLSVSPGNRPVTPNTPLTLVLTADPKGLPPGTFNLMARSRLPAAMPKSTSPSRWR